MLAHQRQLDVISNNIANQGTTAFKRSRANLTDIGYQAGINAPVGQDGAMVRIEGVGEGVELASITADFVPGNAQPTGSGLDIALNGEGFLSVNVPGALTVMQRVVAPVFHRYVSPTPNGPHSSPIWPGSRSSGPKIEQAIDPFSTVFVHVALPQLGVDTVSV